MREHASFHQQWQAFRQQVGISEEALLEEFHLIHDSKQNIVSVRMRIIDQVDDQFLAISMRNAIAVRWRNRRGRIC
ncbi:hypothetical protein [Brevibacillus choshinensis]|uniref:hypothetical protein n=1 Tax=Brevibacillus choshinensis TaxID=54911 RepID=UPI002E1E4918|nr:hypothetical protein [Brevibacillus choshinensis]